MIMARNEDGTYSQVGFVKDNAGIDTEYIYDKDGDIVFEKGFTRETSGTVPLTINGIGKDLKDWSITGNTVQNGTPTPDKPIMPQGTGERTANLYPLDASKLHVGRIENDGTIDYETGTLTVGPGSVTYEAKEAWRGFYTDFIQVNEKEKLTFSPTNSATVAWVCSCYDENDNFLGKATAQSTASTRTFTLLTGTKKVRVSVTSSDTTYTILRPMLNVGSTPLPYEPYGYKIPVVTSADGTEPITTPIYLDKPLYSGEVMRNDGSREVKFDKLVLTSEEAITTHKTFEDGTISIRIPSSKAKANGIIYCTHLQNVSFAEIYNNEKQGISTHLKNELNNLYCLISGFTKLTQYKDFFRNEYSVGTPVTVWYQLAEPTTETFTAPQIPTLNGTTVINVDTAVKPTEMYIKYKSRK